MSVPRNLARVTFGYGLRRHRRANGVTLTLVIVRFMARRLRTRNRVLLRFRVDPGARYEIVGIRRGG